MSADFRQPVSDDTVLVRNIRDDEINRTTGRIKRGAFRPRNNGKDDDGLSVSEPLSDSIQRLCERTSNKGGLFCYLTAGGVRQVEDGGITPLDITPEPTDSDPRHSLIVGMPKLVERQSSDESKALTERLAEGLAQASAKYVPPG